MPALAIAPDTAHQNCFVSAYLPALDRRFNWKFRTLDAEARAEAHQDCIAATWVRFNVAGANAWDGVTTDRTGFITPTILADYAAASYLCNGRRFLGTSIVDAMAPACLKAGRVRLRSLDGPRLAHAPEVEKAIPLGLLTRPNADPATKFRVGEDWREIARRCRPKPRRVLFLLARGYRPGEIAKRLNISGVRVSQIKKQIAQVAADLGYGPRRWRSDDEVS